MPESELGNLSTASERLFEEYLTAHGYTDWNHEQPIPGKPTTPDYRLRFGGTEFCFEVKEFVDDDPLVDGEGDFYDPYRPLREKVNKSARQFKAYKEFPCSVVMADPHHTFVDIDAPEIVLGTMLGNVGYQVPIGVRRGPENPPKQVFTGGGKMVDAKRQQPQNTTINAIVIVSEYPVRLRKLEIALDKRKKELGRSLTTAEFLAVTGSVPTSNLDSVLRVAVHEHPYARMPLSRDLFRGSFDERWVFDGEVYRRVYAGDELRRVEEELEKYDRRSPFQQWLDDRVE
jgi:hypothetical protein